MISSAMPARPLPAMEVWGSTASYDVASNLPGPDSGFHAPSPVQCAAIPLGRLGADLVAGAYTRSLHSST